MKRLLTCILSTANLLVNAAGVLKVTKVLTNIEIVS